MKVKAVQSEEKVTLPEVREILLRVEAERLGHEREMSYELRRSIEHANLLAKTPPEKAIALVEALSALEKMRPEIAYRIANLMPRSRDEAQGDLREGAVLAHGRRARRDPRDRAGALLRGEAV